MKSINKKILIALSILIIVIILSFIFYSSLNVRENFITTSETPSPSSRELAGTPMKDDIKSQTQTAPTSKNNMLSDKEQSLFNDLLNNKLTDVNIQSLINSGFLTENMIERFLSKLTNNNTNETFVSNEDPSNIKAGSTTTASMFPKESGIQLELNVDESNEFVLPNSVFEGFDTNTQIYAKYY